MAKELNNIDVRQRVKSAGMKLWQVADALGVSEPTMTRKLRHELDQEEKAQIFRIIDQIAKEENHGTE